MTDGLIMMLMMLSSTAAAGAGLSFHKDQKHNNDSCKSTSTFSKT
jgi:hypothetical protein